MRPPDRILQGASVSCLDKFDRIQNLRTSGGKKPILIKPILIKPNLIKNILIKPIQSKHIQSKPIQSKHILIKPNLTWFECSRICPDFPTRFEAGRPSVIALETVQLLIRRHSSALSVAPNNAFFPSG